MSGDDVLLPGDVITEKISNAIKDADVLALILSTQSAGSSWVRRELDFARAWNKPVVPVMTEPVEVPEELKNIKWANLAVSYDDGLRQLVRTLQRIRPRSTPEKSESVT